MAVVVLADFAVLALALVLFNLAASNTSKQTANDSVGANLQLLLVGAGTILFGAGYGGFIALQNATVVDVFGLKSFGSAMGIIQGLVVFPGVLGPMMTGALHDFTGDYQVSFWVVAGMFVVAGACVGVVHYRVAKEASEVGVASQP